MQPLLTGAPGGVQNSGWPGMPLLLVACATITIMASCRPDQKDAMDPCSRLDTVDREMLDLVEEILEVHRDKTQFVKNMKHAQVMWIQYRNAMARVYMDAEKRPRDYSEAQKQCKCAKMADLTEQWIDELRFWQSEFDPSETCWEQSVGEQAGQ